MDLLERKKLNSWSPKVPEFLFNLIISYLVKTRTKVVHKNVSHSYNLIKRFEIFKNQKWPHVTFKIILNIENNENIH